VKGQSRDTWQNVEVSWPLWTCISDTALVNLVLYQWYKYGLKLELLTDMYQDIESLDEIDRIMRKPPMSRRALGD